MGSNSEWEDTVGGVPKRDFGAIPPGHYRCQIAGVSEKSFESARGHGKWLKVELKIADREFAGRRINASHMIDYTSTIGEHQKAAFAQSSGRKVAREMLHALGLEKRPEDLRDLLDAKVCVRAESDRQKPNELVVTSYWADHE
jgi:hypothetical protein